MKKSVVLLSIGAVLVAVSFLPLYAYLPATSYWETRPNVAYGNSFDQPIGFFVIGSYVKLDVLIYGGDNRISAQVLDIEQNNITKEVTIQGAGSLAFEVPKNDYYTLNLSNTFQNYPHIDKQILVKVYYYIYNLIFLISGIVILIFGFTLTLYYELKNKARNSDEKRHPYSGW